MTHRGRTATLHPNVFVAPGAVVLGDVTLRESSSVWFNTVIRGDSAAVVVGEHTNIQDNSVVHEDEGLPALIGARVTIGHRAIIHGCVIEDDCLIGMGSVVLSGARIGTGSLIGASSLVRENQTIPPGSLVVGAPARVVGPATDSHREAIRNGSTHYAELARFYMTRGLARGADRRGEVTQSEPPMSAREWAKLMDGFRFFTFSLRTVTNLEVHPLGPRAMLDYAARDSVRRVWVEESLRSTEVVWTAPSPQEVQDDPVSFKAAWEQCWSRREALTGVLEALTPDQWIRPIGHATRGARTLAAWVREWVDEDVEHVQQVQQLVEGSK